MWNWQLPFKIILLAVLFLFTWPVVIVDSFKVLFRKKEEKREFQYRGHMAGLERYVMCALVMFFCYCGFGLWWWFTKVVAYL